MPLYTYQCEAESKHQQDELSSIAGRHDAPDCKKCGAETRLAVAAPAHPVMNPAVPVRKPYNM